MNNRAEQIAQIAAAPQAAPDMRAPSDTDNAGDGYDEVILPDGCPITPLGFLKKTNFFLDFAGQLIDYGSEFRKGEIMMLFGPKMRWLEKQRQFIQWKEVKTARGEPPQFEPDGFNQKKVQEALIHACTAKGLFDPTGKVRGRGAHKGNNGEIILHCGDAVLIGGRVGANRRALKPKTFDTGLIGDMVFPTAPALKRPADVAAPDKVAQSIIDLFTKWNWQGGWIDAYLVYCWTMTAMVGGALKWRPHIWLNGPSGAGKTTLQQLIRSILGDWTLHTEDATEAGLRQLLAQDTIAVMFDEIEPDEHNAQAHTKIVKLARLASSGGDALRGGQDHKSHSFRAASCFLFSSIHHHELPAQDRNRMAIVKLSKFPPKSVMPDIPIMLDLWGDQLRRRMVDQWHRFDATLAAYQAEMLRQGYAGREQDTYGTLLACGDLALYNDVPDGLSLADDADRCAGMVAQLARMLDAAKGEAEDTSERCIRHLTSYRLKAHQAHEEAVGRWVHRAVVAILMREDGSRAARDKLVTYGLKLVHLSEKGACDAYLDPQVQPIYLAVANKSHQSMLEIYHGSMWGGGVWVQALAMLPGAIADGRKVRFDGAPTRSVLVPIDEVIDVEAARQDAHRQMSELSLQGSC